MTDPSQPVEEHGLKGWQILWAWGFVRQVQNLLQYVSLPLIHLNESQKLMVLQACRCPEVVIIHWQ